MKIVFIVTTLAVVATAAPGPSISRDPGFKKRDMHNTAPFNPRYPNQNQTKYCYQSFVDFHRCQKQKGEDYEPCNYFQKVYKSMCPNYWVEKWDEQLEEGMFPGKI